MTLNRDIGTHIPNLLPESPRAVPPGQGDHVLSILRMQERAEGDAKEVGVRPERQTVSVVIPTLNEEKNIAWVLERMPPFVDEVVLVDGHSHDRTVEVARAIRPDIVVLTQHCRGKGDAARVAFSAATGDLIVMIDADGSMDPHEIHRFVTPLMNGYDFVKGSRFLAGGGSTDLTPLRRTGNQMLVRLTNSFFLVHFTDLCYGFCSFRRDCLPALALTAHGFEIETELVVHALKANLRIAEVPSNELPRRCGVSNLRTFRDGQRVLRTLIRERVVRRPRPVVDPIDHRVLHQWQAPAAEPATPMLSEAP
ncbi:glycosyltransferase family 2 protein [Micromonospora yasonensis]|uniref:glycosyltransferase family 2 protein n=1 Tax=Micromonospora yasonensis TaxID=1128667 RepID=UPI002231E085|nr:glycosyltransferase family 2 protein [Micromonospora yasonensis]MCW3843502.1 glycosyltransferase family 2 protein [Micromonospora yasonensis]